VKPVPLPCRIAKIDPDQRLVFGWASIVSRDGELIVDKQGDSIPLSELEDAAYAYVMRSRDMSEMHLRKGIGRLVESVVLSREKQRALGFDLGFEGWWVGFKCNDPDVWARIKSGDLGEFSIGGRALSEEV
jgi:hypothetical protein